MVTKSHQTCACRASVHLDRVVVADIFLLSNIMELDGSEISLLVLKTGALSNNSTWTDSLKSDIAEIKVCMLSLGLTEAAWRHVLALFSSAATV